MISFFILKNKNMKTVAEHTFITKTDGQEYAYVLKPVGDGKFKVLCYDNVERLGVIRGAMKNRRRKVWIAEKDHVLISFRDFSDKKCDIIHKYTPEDVRKLKKMGHLPDLSKLGGVDVTEISPEEIEDTGFDFEDI
jgi:translation initiation factor 1A